MTNPWDGPRHRSWASNTMLTFVLLVVLIIATVLSDYWGEPPNYLVGLLGTAAGAFFAAIGSDKQKKDAEVRETAERAERKADAVGRVTAAEHPDKVTEITPPFVPEDVGGSKGDEDGGGGGPR
ncbi:membrane protein [Mycobacterium phage Heath]|uniref:Membrane protein n=1 Tax=Mycobacterium phage Heath TaxID=2762421 RepID=A0A7G8LFR0_9CAUD|nr:membrane protein [Mycobacterium phage Heath]QNJ56082.1 membrane protein [Mycobacterium phage Heath]